MIWFSWTWLNHLFPVFTFNSVFVFLVILCQLRFPSIQIPLLIRSIRKTYRQFADYNYVIIFMQIWCQKLHLKIFDAIFWKCILKTLRIHFQMCGILKLCLCRASFSRLISSSKVYFAVSPTSEWLSFSLALRWRSSPTTHWFGKWNYLERNQLRVNTLLSPRAKQIHKEEPVLQTAHSVTATDPHWR